MIKFIRTAIIKSNTWSPFRSCFCSSASTFSCLHFLDCRDATIPPTMAALFSTDLGLSFPTTPSTLTYIRLEINKYLMSKNFMRDDSNASERRGVCEIHYVHFRQFPTAKSRYRQKTCWVNSFHWACIVVAAIFGIAFYENWARLNQIPPLVRGDTSPVDGHGTRLRIGHRASLLGHGCNLNL